MQGYAATGWQHNHLVTAELPIHARTQKGRTSHLNEEAARVPTKTLTLATDCPALISLAHLMFKYSVFRWLFNMVYDQDRNWGFL